MDYRTPFFVCYVKNEISNVWSDTGHVSYNTATAALLIATREQRPAVVYKGYEGEPDLLREDFNNRYRAIMHG